jgi:hypothetical protein
MDDPKSPSTEKVGPITIDYETLDVAGLMDQVKVAAARTASADARRGGDFAGAPGTAPGTPRRGPSAGFEPPPGGGMKGRLKSAAFRLMRPFFPLIRFIGLPLHQDIRATVESLHETDVRLDNLDHWVNSRIDKTELRLDLLEERIKDLDESMEYIRLLHTLGHNLVVELTKLRIEFDTLKSKFGILEKDQDYLRARERALEETMRS